MITNLVVKEDISEIILCLKKYGIAIVPKYLVGDDLNDLKKEFLKSFEYSGSGFVNKISHPTNKDGMVVKVNRENLSDDDFPTTKKVFSSKFMHDVLSRYYSPYGCKLNEDIYITHEFPCETPILPWHYDRVQSLKFWIYIKDATKQDGAFEYVPGSHNEGHYRASYHLATGTSLQMLPNDIPEDEILNPVTIEGKAGDLIIFDPDGFHRGGVVGKDGERMVMRGHSHPYPVGVTYGKPLLLSKNWFLQSKLNLANLFKDNYTRVIGNKIKSKASKSRIDKQMNLLDRQ